MVREESPISSIAGGVASDHLASIRLLEKNGFQLAQYGAEVVVGEQLYKLKLR